MGAGAVFARRGSGLVALYLASSAAWAQTTPQPTTPDGLPTRQQVEQPGPQPEARPSSVRVDGSGAFARPPCPLDASTLTAAIERVRFVPAGRDAVPPEILERLSGIAPPVVGTQPIRAVCDVRDAANAALRSAGYVASVQIPPQEITDGTLTLSVVVARITQVRVHGEAGAYRTILARRIAQIQALDPLNERAAERILLLAGDIPGLDIRLSLRPAGTAPGDVIGDVVIATRPFAILGNVQNYGSRQIGRETLYARAEAYSVLRAGDLVYVGGSTTADLREQYVLQAGYVAGLGGSGLTLGLRGTHAWSRPDLGPLDLRSRSAIAGLDLALPLIRTVRRNLSAGGGAEVIEQRTRVFGPGGSSPLNQDRLRVVFARLDGALRERRADGLDAFSLAARVEVRQGLGILGATRRGTITSDGYTPSRFDGDARALVVRSDIDAVARFTPMFSAVSNLRLQYADRALLNLEEFAIGSLTVGRGYDPGANTGDRAAGLHSELRADIFASTILPTQVYAFGDAVWLTNLDQGSSETNRRLRSVGGGMRFALPGRLLLDVGYARPLDRALRLDERRPPGRLLVSLTAQLTPRPR